MSEPGLSPAGRPPDSRGGPRSFSFRRFAGALLIAAGGALVAIPALHRIDGFAAQAQAKRELEDPAVPLATSRPDAPPVDAPDTVADEPGPLMLMEAESEAEAQVDAECSPIDCESPEVLFLPEADTPTATVQAPAIASGALIGRLRAPRIGLDAAVFEGVEPETLRRGPGHVPGTALPGAGGNCVVAAHRDGFFRALAKARAGDRLLFQSEGVEREYRLATRRVVDPAAVEVLDPTDKEQLTLLTCYPFSWIGHAPSRLVWVALPVAAIAGTEAAGTPSGRAADLR